MKEISWYKGREQTYLKHVFLENYLEAVALHIGWSQRRFIFIDGFSGPWESTDQDLEDTSFQIALNVLNKARGILEARGKTPAIECVFIEERADSFLRLESAAAASEKIKATAIHGTFEHAMSNLLKLAKEPFSFTFIDPTGWTGFALETIRPLLQSRGEVLINFMFEHIRRFINSPREDLKQSFDHLFGGPGWEEASEQGEEAMVAFYCQRVRELGSFAYVTYTKVLNPHANRTHFYLVYGTRHSKGLSVFRDVERRFWNKQDEVRADVRQERRTTATGQTEMFREADSKRSTLELQREASRAKATTELLALLSDGKPRSYARVFPQLLCIPHVSLSVANGIAMDLKRNGSITIEGMPAGARIPRDDSTLCSRRTR